MAPDSLSAAPRRHLGGSHGDLPAISRQSPGHLSAPSHHFAASCASSSDRPPSPPTVPVAMLPSGLFHYSNAHELGLSASRRQSVHTSVCFGTVSRSSIASRKYQGPVVSRKRLGRVAVVSWKRLGCSLDRKMSGEIEARGALPAGDGVVRLWCPRRRQSQAELLDSGLSVQRRGAAQRRGRERARRR